MLGRIGPGPVFAYESITAARRWQAYASRSGFVLVLLIGLALVWQSSSLASSGGRRVALHQQLAALGEGFFYTICGVQVALVLLAAPAATAGSICVDRARGTLLHMMVTDLSDAEIVLGKLGARLAPMFGLVACTLPVAALAGLLGGIDFGALAGSFVISLCLAVLGASLALAISVRARKTHEVLMAVYAIEGFWLIAAPIWWVLASELGVVPDPPDFFWKANPFMLAYNPYSDPAAVGPFDLPVFAAATLGLSAALVGWSILALRRAVTESGKPAKAARWRFDWRKYFPSLPNPTLDGNPVLWREWHRDRPSRMARWVWAGTLGLGWALAGFGVYAIIENGTDQSAEMFYVALGVQVGFGLLMLSAAAPTALAEERMRGSLDILLSTPLSTRSIVGAKWRGGFRKVAPLIALPLLGSVLVAASMPETAASPAVVVLNAAVALPPGTVISPLPPGAFVAQAGPGVFVTYVPPGTVVASPSGGTFVAKPPTGPSPAAAPKVELPPVPLAIGERLLAVGLTVADVAASGAAIVSLGLLLATWIKRLGRAVAASVIAYLFMAIGWIILLEFADSLFSPVTAAGERFESPWWLGGLISLSPIAGCIMPIEALDPSSPQSRTKDWLGIALAIAIKGGFAALAFELTVRTFDRALGRVVESRPASLVKAQARRVRRGRAAALVTPGAS